MGTGLPAWNRLPVLSPSSSSEPAQLLSNVLQGELTRINVLKMTDLPGVSGKCSLRSSARDWLPLGQASLLPGTWWPEEENTLWSPPQAMHLDPKTVLPAASASGHLRSPGFVSSWEGLLRTNHVLAFPSAPGCPSARETEGSEPPTPEREQGKQARLPYSEREVKLF